MTCKKPPRGNEATLHKLVSEFSRSLAEEFSDRANELHPLAVAMALARQNLGHKNFGAPLPRALIAGPALAGKTRLAEWICETLNCPCVTVDCATLCPEGYQGLSITDHLFLLLSSKRELSGILILDNAEAVFTPSATDPAILTGVVQSLKPVLLGEKVLVRKHSEKGRAYSSKGVMVIALSQHQNGKLQSNGTWENLRSEGWEHETLSRFSHAVTLAPPSPAAFRNIIEKRFVTISRLYTKGSDVRINELTLERLSRHFGNRSKPQASLDALIVGNIG